MKQKQKKLILGLGLATVLGLGAASGFRWWRSAVLARTGNSALTVAGKHLSEGKAADSLAALDQAKPDAASRPAWEDLEVKAATGALKLDRLLAIHDARPERIMADENASLMVFRALAARGDLAKADAISAVWQEKSAKPEAWILAQADSHMGNGLAPKALKLLLAAKDWKPADEVQRLMRLAILQAPENLPAAWDHLEKAYGLDPKNADIRSFRGQILEARGLTEEARLEYVAALVSEPGSALRRDQLATFYTRQGDFDHAIPTWLEAPAGQQTGFMEFKGRFWARVVSPAAAAKATPASDGDGAWRKALDSMELAPPGKWMAPVPGGLAPALNQHGEIWWLALLDGLQGGDETGVSNALAAPPARSTGIAPDLIPALRTVLAIRAKRPLQNILWPVLAKHQTRPAFFAALERLSQASRNGADLPETPAIEALARHPAAPAYVFAAAGWREAALRLHDWTAATDTPDDMLYTIAVCLKLNRGPQVAADFLKDRPGALFQGLAGELLIASGKTADGLKRLQAAAPDNSDAGRRAGWLLCLAHLEQRDFPSAQTVLTATPGLADSSQGLEIAAKLALATEKPDEATALYRKAADAGSAEGLTWLLRESVKSGDTTAARELSIKLRGLMPDQLQTRAIQIQLPKIP
ncbi:MAG: putative system TPR-repeat lipoprotein [Verrucomicrobiales bacterium]|nr:putative system TPR-repeat lipoprotein [Verrucomicrobiales bacterium]